MAGARSDYEGEELATRGYRRLNPGPGRSPEAVAANQCARLRAAMLELCAELGYPRVTVRALTRRAGVSTRTFYAHFADKEACFLATYDLIVSTSMRGLLTGREVEVEGGDWREPLIRGFRIFSQQLARNPLAARLALVEAFAAGPEALARMRHTDGLFEALVTQSFARPPRGVALPPLLVKGIVAGIARVARGRLLAGRERHFALDGRELMEWAVSFRSEAVLGIDRLPVPPSEPFPPPASAPAFEDDRSLILAATARLVTAGGYEALSVPAILSRAGLPRRSFDDCFEDVADCFLACLDRRGAAVLAEALSAFESADSWPAAVHRAVDSLCARIAVDPTFAMLAFRELYSPGRKGVRWRVEATSQLSAALRDSAPASQAPSGLAAEASLGGIWGVIHGHVVAGATPRLRGAAPALSLLVLAPAIGPEAASAAILAEVGGRGRKGTGAG
jgi:AcrR family transcriptional regulator